VHRLASLPRTAMLVLRVLFASLALISSAVGAPSAHKRGECHNPSVRREWRAFSSQEKAAWIQAVNVRVKLRTDFPVV
jgi:hypothetical protein